MLDNAWSVAVSGCAEVGGLRALGAGSRDGQWEAQWFIPHLRSLKCSENYASLRRGFDPPRFRPVHWCWKTWVRKVCSGLKGQRGWNETPASEGDWRGGLGVPTLKRGSQATAHTILRNAAMRDCAGWNGVRAETRSGANWIGPAISARSLTSCLTSCNVYICLRLLYCYISSIPYLSPSYLRRSAEF